MGLPTWMSQGWILSFSIAAGADLAAACGGPPAAGPGPSVPAASAVPGTESAPVPAVGAAAAVSIPHELAGKEKCASCHQVGGAGAGAPSGTGLPDSHKGRGDETCQGCHKAK